MGNEETERVGPRMNVGRVSKRFVVQGPNDQTKGLRRTQLAPMSATEIG